MAATAIAGAAAPSLPKAEEHMDPRRLIAFFAMVVGMGTVGEGQAFVSLGTSGVLFAANASYLPNPESAVHAFCHGCLFE